MFSEVRHALLPLALRKIQRRGDLERAGLLIESLAKHWRDAKPFKLSTFLGKKPIAIYFAAYDG